MTDDQPNEAIVLHEGMLDAERLAELFADLAEYAEITDVLLKGGAVQYAGEQAVTLAEAHAQLAAGAVRGAQIRYRFDGRAWCDTLLHGPTGLRVVRMDVTHLGG